MNARAEINTTMRLAGQQKLGAELLPCVLTIRYLETTLFASLIRHVVRTAPIVYIFASGVRQEGRPDEADRDGKRVSAKARRRVR